jgi:hypothetical protein
MALGFGRGRGRERETRGCGPFALHAPIHQAILGVGDQEEGKSSRLLLDLQPAPHAFGCELEGRFLTPRPCGAPHGVGVRDLPSSSQSGFEVEGSARSCWICATRFRDHRFPRS